MQTCNPHDFIFILIVTSYATKFFWYVNASFKLTSSADVHFQRIYNTKRLQMEPCSLMKLLDEVLCSKGCDCLKVVSSKVTKETANKGALFNHDLSTWDFLNWDPRDSETISYKQLNTVPMFTSIDQFSFSQTSSSTFLWLVPRGSQK